jgi:hypothetical protein
MILPIGAYLVARITGPSHERPARKFFSHETVLLITTGISSNPPFLSTCTDLFTAIMPVHTSLCDQFSSLTVGSGC